MGEILSFCKSLKDLPEITAKSVAEAVYKEDQTAIAVYSLCASYLGRGLCILIDLLNPQLIILEAYTGERHHYFSLEWKR